MLLSNVKPNCEERSKLVGLVKTADENHHVVNPYTVASARARVRQTYIMRA